MFLKTLRQLTVMEVENEQIDLTYLCKLCNKKQTVRITKEQYNDLRCNIPFSVVFRNDLATSISKTLPHLRTGICINHE